MLCHHHCDGTSIVHAPIKVYRFKVLLFGLSCAPTIAMGAIHKLCRIVLENSNSTDAEINAANRLAQDIYVDDFLSGFDTEQENTMTAVPQGEPRAPRSQTRSHGGNRELEFAGHWVEAHSCVAS